MKISPLDERFEEGLRMCAGLTLAEEELKVIFTGRGKEGLRNINVEKVGMRDYRKHLETLKELGVEIKETENPSKLAQEIKDADRVIVI